jgi:hypothetical protein
MSERLTKAIFAAAGAIALVAASSVSAQSAPAPKVGGTCTSVGAKADASWQILQCKVVKGKKKWADITPSIPLLIRKLAYNQNQAFALGTEAGLAFVNKTNYPGLFNRNDPDYIEYRQFLIDEEYSTTLSLNTSTLEIDSTWLMPETNCSVGQDLPLPGRTYLVTATETTNYLNFGTETNTYDLHITILAGKAYYYFPIC